MRDPGNEGGFTLIELLIASLITMLVMGVAFTTFDNALAMNDTAIALADSSQNLRAGTNQLVRDLLQAGRNIPIGGIPIPHGAGAQGIYRPSPPNQTYYFDNTTQDTLQAITTGNALGPTVDGNSTDMITMIMDDPYLDPLTVYPSTQSGTVPKLASDGSSLDVGSSTAWLAGDLDNGIAPIKVGDLLYFLNATGSAIQTVTAVTTTTVSFASGDPFRFNQRSAPAGSITQILGSTMQVRRVLMWTYYVYADQVGVPRLQRVLNHFPKTPLAGVIEDLNITYDLVDGTTNPAGVADLPYSSGGSTFNASQIRKANLHIGVRSETISARTKDYLRNHVNTVVAIRNLAYVDRYQ
jgi:hypothetical protein